MQVIWGIADDCLRDVYVRGKYRDVILPMTVIRRLDRYLHMDSFKPQRRQAQRKNTVNRCYKNEISSEKEYGEEEL